LAVSLEIVLSEDRLAGLLTALDCADPELFAEFVRGSDVPGEGALTWETLAANLAIVARSATVGIVATVAGIHGLLGRSCSGLLGPNFGPGMSWVCDGGVRRVEVGVA
jgi:hypothetical protein